MPETTSKLPPREHLEKFTEVLQAERQLLGLPDGNEPAGVGLALSGGGIRSASFALGVVQAFFARGYFKSFHYLSTVSGGGFLGASLTWQHKQAREEREGYATTGEAPTRSETEAFVDQFGSPTRGARDEELDLGTRQFHQVWLDFIRQHGNYLKPPRVGDLTLIGIALRGALLSFGVYVLAGAIVFAWMGYFGLIRSPLNAPHVSLGGLNIKSFILLFGGILALMISLYGIATWLASIRRWQTILTGSAVVLGFGYASYLIAVSDLEAWMRLPLLVVFLAASGMSGWYLRRVAKPREELTQIGSCKETAYLSWQYESRARTQQYLGLILTLLLVAVIVASVPPLYELIEANAAASASVSSVLGGVVAAYQFVAGRERSKTVSLPINLVLILGAALLAYGALLFAYMLSWRLTMPGAWLADAFGVPVLRHPAAALSVALLLIAALGYLANVNMIGVARMYRDRLMEAFMPDRRAVVDNEWQPAFTADIAPITRFRDVRPLHLVNCNVVMIDAHSDSYRGRGGDSFVISPLYSGSSATGWIRTEHLGTGGDRFTLATAMAISGAAANPNTGSAGRGVTRNRAVSFLLSLLNIRLGYWLSNPAASKATSVLSFAPPNFWFPGLRQGLFGRGLNETAAFVELTDGGHFDNTGLYELIRRRTRFIVLSQASQDGEFAMADLANAIERVRVDFGVHIRFNLPGYGLDRVRPDAIANYAQAAPFAVARIRYPRHPGCTRSEVVNGMLLYLQAVPVKDMHADVHSYWRSHPSFPNESTANQFFTEEQLEAYRELGLQITEGALLALFDIKQPASEDLVELVASLRIALRDTR